MTEAEWDACYDPQKMLDFLRGRGSDRKLRLFACAACRQAWDELTDPASRRAVQVAEHYADGLVGRAELARAAKEVPQSEWTGKEPDIFNWYLVTPTVAADMTDLRTYAWLTAEPNLPDLTPERAAALWAEHGDRLLASDYQADLLREIVSNPFRPVALDPSWLAWNDGAIRKMAQSVYDARAFDRLPLLADALEEAGCDNAGVLTHCRQPGEHVRGCWVVDLLLGKT